MRVVFAFGLAVFAIIGIAICGCGKAKATGPATVPVRGKIVFTKGGIVKTLADKQARIELESMDQPGIRAAGPIQEDGTFEVATVTAEGGGNAGAVPGTHRVRLDLEGAERLVAPQFLDFTKSGITIKVPSDEPVEVKIFR